jgi:hypothetical protein
MPVAAGAQLRWAQCTTRRRGRAKMLSLENAEVSQ